MDQSQFATLLVVALSRATERILLVMVGALAVYLGYCLFREIPTAKNAEGKVELPGGVSIFLTRIGPGVFFALFGIAVIGYSVAQPVRLDLPNVAVLSGLGQQPGPSTPVLVSGPEPERVVAKLNGLVLEARQRLDPPAAAEFESAVRSAKYSVMLGRWNPRWGERAAFERWARDNGDKDPPDHLGPATLVFMTVLR
jgi:branched-subunit amino acid transport protein